MPTCENCGSFVTAEYVRVFAPSDQNSVRVCPECPDKLREQDNTIREKRQ